MNCGPTQPNSRPEFPRNAEVVGFGIVGTGMIAGRHAEVISGLKNAKLVGVAGRTAEAATAFAARHGIPIATVSIAELAARPDIQFVCVATPSGGHLDSAMPAIAGGKHVIVEKPLEITTVRGENLIAAAERAGVHVAPIFQARFGAGARHLKAALTAGRFGRLVLCSAYVKWHRASSYYTGWKGTLALDGGGALMNQGSHAVDLLLWFAGRAEQVFGSTTRRVHSDIEAEDTVSASIRFASGALGTIEATTAAWPGWSRRIEICGETGSASLEDDRLVKWEFKDAQPDDTTIRAISKEATDQSGAASPSSISNEGHQRQFEDIIESVRQNRAPQIDARDALLAVSLIEAIYKSARTNAPVKL